MNIRFLPSIWTGRRRLVFSVDHLSHRGQKDRSQAIYCLANRAGVAPSRRGRRDLSLLAFSRE